MLRYYTLIILITSVVCSWAQEANDSTKTTHLDELVVVGKTIKESPTGYKIRLQDKEIVKGKNVTETLGFLPNVTVENGAILIYEQFCRL